MVVIISLLLLICAALPAAGADISVEELSKNIEMIPESEALSIRSIGQDDKGMIWFGTDKNLYSYDGYNIVVRHDIRGGNDHYQINTLLCSGSKILLGCMDGIVIYDMIQETFTPVEFLNGIETHALQYDSVRDVIWIGCDAGLFFYAKDSGTISAAIIDSDTKPANIWSLHIQDDHLYIGMRSGFGVYDLSGSNRYIPLNLMKGFFEKRYSTIGAIESSDDGTIYIGASTFLAEYSPESPSSDIISDFSWVKTISKADDLFLLGTDAGLYSFCPGNNEIRHIKKTVVWDILSDMNGNIWFGTDNGLMMFKSDNLIDSIEGIPENANHLFTSISGNRDGLFFAGGSYGMVVFDDINQKQTRWYNMEDSEFPFRHNKVRQIVYDESKDDIWVSTASGALKFNKETNLFDLYVVSNNSFYQAYDICFSDGKMWFAALDGLCCVQNDSIARRYTVKDGLTSNRINQVTKDRNGRIWMRSFDRNIFILDPDTDIVSQYRFPNNAITRGDQIFSDSEGSIWITSANHVYQIKHGDPVSGFYDYNLKGHPTNHCTEIIEVDRTIWVCFSNGIYILDKAGKVVTKISTRKAYSEMYFDKANNRVLLGTLDRIDFINISDLEKHQKSSTSSIHITNVVINGNYTLTNSEIHTGRITLPHDKNNLVVSFSNFTFNRENPPIFNYMLEGNGSQWNETKGQGNNISFSNLSPGTYHLHIIPSGSPEKDAPIMTIHINRPWYLSSAAIIFYLMVFAGVAYTLMSFLTFHKKIKDERIQKAYEMSQAKSKINFFADVAHEFKTPLSLIIAPVSKIIQESTDPDQKRTLQMIHDNAIKLNSLIHFSLDFYKDSNDMGKSIISSTVEVVSFMERILNTYKETSQNLDFIFRSDYDEIHASIDVIKTETIISNILSNACRYTPKGGSIIMTLDYDSDSDMLLVRISDTGLGIPSSELPLIFERYYQSSRTRKLHSEGTGIGLSIVKNYVDILNGTINVSSGENGTSFTITLPILKEKETDNTSEVKAIDNASNKNPLIIIIDDNKSVCEFLVSILSDKYRCMCAHNGKNGLKLCQDMIPDLIISDVVMPVMDGLEMCREIRKIPVLSIIPIILLTAKDDKETEKASISLNIDSFVGKPFDMDTLTAKVDQLIGHKKLIENKVRLQMISEPKNTTALSSDEKFLLNVTKIIEDNLDDTELSVSRLSELCRYNEKQMYRKIKSMTGLSTIEYIKSIRMKRAAQLLQNGNFTVSEVMYMVGFSNTSYFARTFLAQFGKTPKEYMKDSTE